MIEIPEDLIVDWYHRRLWRIGPWCDTGEPGTQTNLTELVFPSGLRNCLVCSAITLDPIMHPVAYDSSQQMLRRAVLPDGSPGIHKDPETGAILTIWERRPILIVPAGIRSRSVGGTIGNE